MNRRFAFAVLLACAMSASAQPVYRWTDAQGRVHYGDRPPASVDARPVDIAPPPPGAGFPAAVATGTPDSTATAGQRQPLAITMYATATCGYCAKARRFFAQRGIAYREKDIDRYAQARTEWKRLGGKGVPLFVINGEVSSGFSADSMARALSALGW